MTTKFPNIS